jgi:hypothetical protein
MTYLQRHPWLPLLLLTALLYLPGTDTLPLMDRDEPRFAHATVEMMQRDTWLIPYFNGEYRFDKPPLTYWWMRLHYLLFGVNELAARLHSVVAVWLVSLVIFQMAQRLFDRTAAWWASMAWLTSLQVLVHGRLCVADMPMVLFVALSMWAVTELMLQQQDTPARSYNRWWWLLWVSQGLGFLAKGPIALLIPLLALILWRFVLWRQKASWSRLQVLPGALLVLLIVGAWGIPALLQTQGAFWNVGMGEHVVKRGTQSFNGRMILPGYYLVTAFLSLMPWIALLPLVWKHLRGQWNATYSLLAAWFLAPQLIFLFYATQLPHYVMPGFPAWFLVLGVAIAQSKLIKMGKFAAIYLTLIVMLAVAVQLLPQLIGPFDFRIYLSLLGISGILLALVCGLVAAISFKSRIGVMVAMVLLVLSLFHVGESLRKAHPAALLASPLKALPSDAALIAWQFTEPSLVFYSNSQWTMLSKLDKVEKRLSEGKADAIVLLCREWTLQDWTQHFPSKETQSPTKDFLSDVERLTALSQGYTIHDVEGLNLARSSWVQVRLLIRDTKPL